MAESSIIEAVDPVLRTLNDMRVDAFYALVVLTLVAGVLWWLDRRATRNAKAAEAKASEDAETRRQASLSKALSEQARAMSEQTVTLKGLAGAVEGLRRESSTNTQQMCDELSNVAVCVGAMNKNVRDLRDRQMGVIGRVDSIRICEDKFDHFIRREVEREFEFSLRQNDWANRSNFIRDRVRTKLADIIRTAQRALADYKLGIDTDPYFVQRTTEKGTRFRLVDDLWEQVEPLYVHSASVDNRIEEMRVRITNVIGDAVHQAEAEVNDLYRDGDSSGLNEAVRQF